MNSNQFTQQAFKPGYGEFPYVIVKIGYALMIQIPIHFVAKGASVDLKKHPGTQIRDVSEEVLSLNRDAQIQALKERVFESGHFVVKRILERYEKLPPLCMVLGSNEAYYYKDGQFEQGEKVPYGGTLLDQSHNILAMNAKHYLEEQ